uniref:Uncharacterized protein n=1 Tax=Anguilla anguilla TaxID=7936 RepID=A0A0E9Q3J1_ANGAN
MALQGFEAACLSRVHFLCPFNCSNPSTRRAYYYSWLSVRLMSKAGIYLCIIVNNRSKSEVKT